jgi:ParB-like nuclease domain
MDDMLLMTSLARLNEDYIVLANKLDMFYQVGFKGDELRKLEMDCWVARRNAYRLLVRIRDLGGEEYFITRKAFGFGWLLKQIDNPALRELLCKNDDADLADPAKPGGPSDYSDPNPTDAEHVMNMMRSNFPENAIEWVMRAKWTGPVQVPWERIDKDDIEGWAASHQPDAVNRFAKNIKAGTGNTNPSVLIQDNNTPKAIIIDGHHRALAHHKLGQPVLAYLGNIDPADRMAAEETHSKQVHSGEDPGNR